MYLSFAIMANPIPLSTDFIDQLKAQLGESKLNIFIEALNQNPTLSIRSNPFKKTFLASDGQVPWCPTGYYLNERPSFTLDPIFHAGGYYVQEASSMFLEQAVRHSIDINQPLKVLDLCAAPGGKSTHLLSLINQQSLLVSNEVIRSRANILCENIQKWGTPNVIVTQNDPSQFKKLNGLFDLIVVDAPCSGEGLFRKEREAISEWSPSNVALCCQRQQRILSDVFPALRQDGILIYCTCTYNRKENEENLLWLANQHQVEFISIPLQADWGIEEVMDGKIIGYRFFPHQAKGEGFFISAMRKICQEQEARVWSKELPRNNKKVEEKISHWFTEESDHILETMSEKIRLLPKQSLQAITYLLKQLNVLQAGTAIGDMKHEKIIPDHALALSILLKKESVTTLELSKADALQYLRKENFQLPSEKTGFTMVTYSGLGLGWVNGLGNRFNNLYPMTWRIRMR
jgi:16S rRNA C967 or C1407 C5-methylase (RsmB/RsmF family)/NOL1/NOP2/fmu family ribosome biogenesis protein